MFTVRQTTYRWEWWMEQGPHVYYPNKHRSEFERCVLVHSLERDCGEKAKDYVCQLYDLPYGIDVRTK